MGYDARSRRIVVGYGDGALGFLDPNGKKTGDIPLDAHPESFQLEREGARLFVNVPTAGHIAVVDRASMKVAATWRVSTAASNFPMALDEAGHRLFVGCRRPARLLVYDTSSGKEIAAIEKVTKEPLASS